MPKTQHEREDPAKTLKRLRKSVSGGSNLRLDTLTKAELSAAQSLIFSGEAEIVSSACKPFLTAKLDRIIIS
ncbi:MAG: hypothetical protein WBM41_05235 [Arenicellales bacterium]